MPAANYGLSADDRALLRRFRTAARTALADPDAAVRQVAGQLGLSERTFYRKLKELTGHTPAAYLRELRLSEARRLLESRQVGSVEAAAFAVGFEDVAYFARVFYRRFGQRARDLLA